jgi:hypothetical protein
MRFTDKEIQDKWKAHLDWLYWTKRYSDEMKEIGRKYHNCYVLAERLKKEHSEMVKANRDKRNASN